MCNAQSLVQNGDFEQYSGCPNGLGQIDSALYWINTCTFNPQLYGSPDYYNQCDLNYVSVPTNIFGFQYAHSGSGYCGIYLMTTVINNYREYIETHLQSPLIANNCYFFEMYVNLGDQCNFVTTELGVYFSDTLVANINNYLPLPFTPQINNATTNVFDTINWIVVNGTYTATGTENYLIIGNFKDDANTSYSFNGNGNISGAYVYIDDVCLRPCNGSCTTGMEEQAISAAVKIYPNPIMNKLNVWVKNNELSEIIIYDITSRKIFNQSFTNSTSINTEQLAKGIYLYEVRNKNGVIKKGKVVKD